MTTTRLEFGMRENTASSRQHASRLSVNLSSPKPHRLQTNQSEELSPQSRVLSESQPYILDGNAAADGATGGKKMDGTQLLSVQEVARLLQFQSHGCMSTRARDVQALFHT